LLTVGRIWAHFSGFLHWEKIELMSTIIIIIYSTIARPIEGQDGMDASEQLWMSFPFWEASAELMLAECWAHFRTFFRVLALRNFVIKVYYNNKELSCPYPGHWGVGWGGLLGGTLDVVKLMRLMAD
jgi:hypothetical protein